MQKYLIIFAIALCSIFASVSHAADNGNGVDVTTKTFTTYYEWNATWFSNYNPTVTANFVYNESDEATATAGEFETQFILDKGVITIEIVTLGSTSIDFVIEGRNKNGNWDVLVSRNYTTVIVESFPIVNYYYDIRTGLKVNTNGTDDINVTSDFMTIRRSE